MENNIPEMLTIAQTAERSGLSYDSIRKKCLTREIVCIRNGRKYLVNWGRFLDYLNGSEVSDANSRVLS